MNGSVKTNTFETRNRS